MVLSLPTGSLKEFTKYLKRQMSNGFTAEFEFKGKVDIGAIGRLISEYVL